MLEKQRWTHGFRANSESTFSIDVIAEDFNLPE